ncbi:MAG: YbjN domain-containing protein [Flavobacteriaceae bacterium]|nr:YbjN domain-containing protein [Flavobacteriaceae bacterium]
MENILPKYVRPLKSGDKPTVDVDFWDKAIDAFDENQYKKAVIATINYINPTLLKDKNMEEDIEIVHMQGSAEIYLKVTKDTFSIKAPFLKITDKTNKVALLRKVSEINFSPLTLAQITLNNTELWFEYEMPITVCQPNKVYDLLREVCVYSDDFDDMFIEDYKASFYKEPNHSPLSDSEKEQVWTQINDIFEDYKNYSQFFKDKQWDDYEWDITIISLLKIANMPYMNGILRSDLQEYINNLSNGSLDFQLRMDKGTNFIKKLVDKSREEIMSNVYHADQFISLRWRSSEQIVKDWAKNRLEVVQKYENNNDNLALSYYLQFNFLKLIYSYNLEKNYIDVIDTILENVTGLDLNSATPKLVEVFHALRNGTIDSKKNKKGFFSKLFN